MPYFYDINPFSHELEPFKLRETPHNPWKPWEEVQRLWIRSLRKAAQVILNDELVGNPSSGYRTMAAPAIAHYALTGSGADFRSRQWCAMLTYERSPAGQTWREHPVYAPDCDREDAAMYALFLADVIEQQTPQEFSSNVYLAF